VKNDATGVDVVALSSSTFERATWSLTQIAELLDRSVLGSFGFWIALVPAAVCAAIVLGCTVAIWRLGRRSVVT
jgi:hypothetical protein